MNYEGTSPVLGFLPSLGYTSFLRVPYDARLPKSTGVLKGNSQRGTWEPLGGGFENVPLLSTPGSGSFPRGQIQCFRKMVNWMGQALLAFPPEETLRI